MRYLLATITIAVTLTACGPFATCTPNETRCTGTLVQVCDADGQWDVAEDCAAVSGDDAPFWMCCPVPADDLGPAGHACVPADGVCPAEDE